VAVRLTAAILTDCYLKEEKSLMAANKSANSHYTNTKNEQASANSSHSESDQSRHVGVELGGGANAAMNATASVAGAISAGMGKWLGGPQASVAANASGSGAAAAGGRGLFNFSRDKADVTVDSTDDSKYQDDQKTDASSRVTDNAERIHQFKEVRGRWIETRVGYTKIAPGWCSQVPVEIDHKSQVVYMTVFVADGQVPICRSSPVPDSNTVNIEYNQKLRMFVATACYRANFRKQMIDAGLAAFVQRMEDIGLDDHCNWMHLTEDDLLKSVHFTKWQIATFVRIAKAHFGIDLKFGPDTDAVVHANFNTSV